MRIWVYVVRIFVCALRGQFGFVHRADVIVVISVACLVLVYDSDSWEGHGQGRAGRTNRENKKKVGSYFFFLTHLQAYINTSVHKQHIIPILFFILVFVQHRVMKFLVSFQICFLAMVQNPKVLPATQFS